ncbi:MAG: MASE1 domain-containing protein [Candidatus Omnitrophica bacterium]|nr:MASE1 domain-containing protein [Candidatus Omnitrophota bacterium]
MKLRLPSFRTLVLITAIAAIYYASARFGLTLALERTNASPVWPPSGIAFAFVLLLGYRIWPGIAIGAFLANLTTFLSYGDVAPIPIIVVSSLIAVGNTLEAICGAFLLRLWIGSRNPFDHALDYLRFFLTVLLMCAVAATIGPTTLLSFGFFSKTLYPVVWFTWWLGDIVGILVLTPIFIAWRPPLFPPRWKLRRYFEILLFAFFFWIMAETIFGTYFHVEGIHFKYTLILFVIYAAFRFGQIGASLAVLTLSAITIWNTYHGIGPFVVESQNESLLILQLFIAATSFTSLFVSAVLNDQKNTEEKLRQDQERTHLILETANDAFIGMDEKGDITDWNRQAQMLFGWLREEVIGRPLAGVIIPHRYREAHWKGLKHFFATHEGPILNKRLELSALHRKGHEFLVELTVWPIRFEGSYRFNAVLRDITERKRAEERLKQVIEFAPNAMVMVNQEGKIMLANQMVEKVFGYSHEELVGKPIETLVPHRFREKHESDRKVFHQQPTARPVAGRELYGLHKNGTEIPVEIGLSPVETPDGTLVLAAIIDISERKQAEKRVAQFVKEIESANEELRGFAHIVSHDLKAPLRGIATVVEWLMNDYRAKLGKKGEEWLELINERVNLSHTLIDGILEYSSVGQVKGKAREIDLNVLVREVIDVLMPPENISVEVESTLPTIHADPVRIRQIFQNLIGNAIKYMDKPNGKIKIRCEPDGAYWKFSISDNGPGISENYFEKIFQMFQTLQRKDKSKSTGIGLALVKKIVESYGGSIWLESKVGEGSTFYFTLPSKGAVVYEEARQQNEIRRI